jgi:hypothetical protein
MLKAVKGHKAYQRSKIGGMPSYGKSTDPDSVKDLRISCNSGITCTNTYAGDIPEPNETLLRRSRITARRGCTAIAGEECGGKQQGCNTRFQ